MWFISPVRVPVGQLRMGIGRGEQEMRGMSGLELPPGDLHHEASLQVPILELLTESGMGQSRPSLTQPQGSSSLVSFVLNSKVQNPSTLRLILCSLNIGIKVVTDKCYA